MGNMEILLNRKLTKLIDFPTMKIDDKQLRPYTLYDCCRRETLNFDTNNYLWREVHNSGSNFAVVLTSIRMMTSQIAIEYAESVIESEKKNLDESGVWCWDPVIHACGVPYLKYLPITRAYYIRTESS
jgi:hypothetical protein